MAEERIVKLAGNLINYSVELQPGEKILIEVFDGGEDLAQELVAAVYKAGGVPFVSVKNMVLQRELLRQCAASQVERMAAWEKARMEEMDAYIGLRAYYNHSEMADLPQEQSQLYQRLWWHPVHSEVRVNRTKWCVLRYPNAAMAQMSGMSTAAFRDFYFQVTNLDYSRLAEAEEPLLKLMEKTKEVRILGQGTDLTFSLEGVAVSKSCGLRNIPDGEVFTAPVKQSVNGVISYNCPSVYQGVTFADVRLEFAQGRIVKATANHTEQLNQILDTDEGARYIGEFALGVNPHITKPMGDILFDEKISGSFHFTPGNAYENTDNGNRSAIHWDLVCMQTPAYGGGEIWFDGRLVRKDGLFVLEELQGLNPQAWR